MAKKKVGYVRIRYDREEDAFCLETMLSDENSWGLVVQCDCQRSANWPDEREAEFVHFTILRELDRALSLGYQYERMC